jgi:hypothetical protein
MGASQRGVARGATVDIGIHLNFTNPGGDEVVAPLLARTAKVADDAGFANVER